MRVVMSMFIVAAVVAGCGGSGEDTSSTPDRADTAAVATTETADPDTGSAVADAPNLEAVLACMTAGGLEATDQSSSTGPKIGVDLSAGRLVMSFEETEEDAETAASVAESQDPNGRVVQDGNVVIFAPDDPAAETAVPIAERCVDAK